MRWYQLIHRRTHRIKKIGDIYTLLQCRSNIKIMFSYSLQKTVTLQMFDDVFKRLTVWIKQLVTLTNQKASPIWTLLLVIALQCTISYFIFFYMYLIALSLSLTNSRSGIFLFVQYSKHKIRKYICHRI